jgi:tetratricopeptide (TPR) repeat protein
VFSHLSIQELLSKLEELGDQVPMELVQAILAKEPEAVIPLRDILHDDNYWEAEDNRQLMPLHAVKLLGMLADPRALPQLVNALILACKVGDYLIMKDLPTVFGRIGPPAIPLLEEFIHAHKGDNKFWYPRSTAADGLLAIALHNPHEQERILTFLHELFSEEDDEEFLGFAAKSLLNFSDPSSIPVLEKAFNRGIIDDYIIRRDDLLKKRVKPLGMYNNDLLHFYDAEQVAERRSWREKEREIEYEKERHAAQKLEQREKSIAVELKRLEIANTLNERNVLPLSRKVGRNDPCPCGSGNKFKKCCFSFVKALPPRQVLGNGFYYSKWADLQKAPPYDTILVLENLTFLASDAEREGDIVRALELFRILEPLAEQKGLLGELLRHFRLIVSDHPELGEEGLDILRRLRSFHKDSNQEQWVYTSMDIADYLGGMGRWDECRNEYGKLIDVMPEDSFIRVGFARILEKGNYPDEAVASYEHVLRMGDQADEDDLEIAARELRELAASHNIELDAWTIEAIGNIRAGEEGKNVTFS